MNDVFLSLTAANLFLYKLAVLSFLASKPGFQFIHTYQATERSKKQGLSQLLKDKKLKKNSLLHNTFQPNPILSYSAERSQRVYNLEFFEKTLTNILKHYHTHQIFRWHVEIYFKENFKIANSLYDQSDSDALDSHYRRVIEQSKNANINSFTQAEREFNHMPHTQNLSFAKYFIINSKIVAFYKEVIIRYRLLQLSYNKIFESLILTNFSPSFEAEEDKHQLLVYLFTQLTNPRLSFPSHNVLPRAISKELGKEQRGNTWDWENVENSLVNKDLAANTKIKKKDNLLMYWITDFLSKMQTSTNLEQSVNSYNSIIKTLETLSIFQTYPNQIFNQIFLPKDLQTLELGSPIHPNIDFLNFISTPELLPQIENKIFLLNLVQLYQHYHTKNFVLNTQNDKSSDALWCAAQSQALEAEIHMSERPHSIRKI